ncbi:aminodeoxychorismate synthase component I [Myroides pelagicus]|uniref:Aminodeoxychorismate synthase component I n=1 Tax=Myroides pelagicus TaxID=270914 RepID=A0A7K1GNM4_9FLAO|nr:aminodeoxychorismate synthase component I [Myroides pelagicus]MEC4115159.1 aminodeoxychorismate synthase component I [Myroides pelagicus]MTH30446.1 aminodeoxychorismate synthase component I [Myroides pelagicus]
MRLKDTTITKMNELGKQRIPFLFIIDFGEQNTYIKPLDQIDHQEVRYNFNGVTNTVVNNATKIPILKPTPISFELYNKQFEIVKKNIQLGNSYLLNLTIQTPIQIDCDLNDIYAIAQAKYKLYYKNQFVCFSPEIFVQIKNKHIYSYPMKGTIDGTLENAEQQLLNNPKENAEHFTIVDLIRNDLNIVAKKVKVDRFKYIDKLITTKGSILQMSSQISGELSDDWHANLGNIFNHLLPAGSITGSPKEKTLEIIQEAETYNRRFYTGVCGIYDGDAVDSAVMIRFIEKEGSQYSYKSGGGITYSSDPYKEYEELLQKIYIPM